MDLPKALCDLFGHSEFRPGQERVIEALLAGQSALALFPTGAGKSLCYQLPAVLLEGTALVISPLIALMKDQVDALRARGIKAARLDSSLSAAETREVVRELLEGTLKLLYVAPERLSNEAFLERLSRVKISLMAIDEAHCISEWGHNFRPEYMRLSGVAKTLSLFPVLALTATATPEVARDIRTAFQIEEDCHVQTSFRRKNLHLQVSPVSADTRLPRLIERLKDGKVRPAVVYVTFQKTAEEVSARLLAAGLQARAYHAGMDSEERNRVQEEFMRGECEIMVATIAFGMGIDKADIRSVIHFNLPKTLENYQQEIGRAGRDGAPALCELLASGDDAIPLENFTLGDTPTPEAVLALVRKMLGSGSEFHVSRYDLSQDTDIRPLVVDTVITYLELEGLLQPTHAFYDSCSIEQLRPEEEILEGHTAERREFLRRLFQAGQRGRKYITLEVEKAVQTLGETRERINKALSWLEEKGQIVVKPKGLRHAFRLCGDAGSQNPEAVADRLATLFRQREERDSLRLRQILEFATSTLCITRRLLAHFGESLEETDCGHCDPCRLRREGREDPASGRLPASLIAPFSREDERVVRALMSEEFKALASIRQLTRYLCGLTSPATSRARLGKRREFGMFGAVPFPRVLEWLGGMQERD